MKYLTIILFIVFNSTSKANNYYLSSSMGDDSRTLLQAQNPATPWKTIDKLNSFKSLRPGDSVLFKKGDTFYGSLTVNNSGMNGNPITYGAYGVGINPEISGFEKITKWTNVKGNICSATLTNFPNVVMVDGKIQQIGRYPKTSYKIVTTSTSSTSITDPSLIGSTDFTGAEAVIRKERYIIDRNLIISHTGSTINFASNGSGFNPKKGLGYFIQNCRSALTTLGDWYWSIGTFYMYDGNVHNVHASSTGILVTISNQSHITLDGLNLQGGNTSNLYLNSCSYVSIKNCNINFSGVYGINGKSATHTTIDNCFFDQNMNDGIVMDDNSANATIVNNKVSNTAIIAGMGGSGSGNYNAIQAFGSNTLLQYNVVTNTGGGGISFAGSNSSVINNFVDSFGFVKDDCGGIYIGKGGRDINKVISGNIILNGIGASQGTPFPNQFFAEGIYCDDHENSITISNNTISKCNDGIKLHNAYSITISGNLCFDNNYQIDLDHDQSGAPAITGLNISSNCFVAKVSSQYVLRFNTIDNDVKQFGISDNNYYLRLIDDSLTFITHDPINNGANWYDMSTQTLSQWQIYSGQDAHSHKFPKKINDINDLKFEYNADSIRKMNALRPDSLGVFKQF